MPYMSGMEVLERIMEFDPTTEVILASIESGRAGALCGPELFGGSRDAV